jgi:hypothetical protein
VHIRYRISYDGMLTPPQLSFFAIAEVTLSATFFSVQTSGTSNISSSFRDFSDTLEALVLVNNMSARFLTTVLLAAGLAGMCPQYNN